MSFGKYQFLSWARRGIARNIKETDTLGASAGDKVERAQISIDVQVNGAVGDSGLKKDFLLIGPGDVTGIQNSMIIRTEPLLGIADYEPNLLPYIEFYDEDFPWRYTPASPAGANKDHQRPWLALVVLKEGEFEDTTRRQPLPSIKVLDQTNLPPADQLHLWAHMHSNLAHEKSELETFLDDLEEDAKRDPDGVYSRILCPRKLAPNVLYHAFLVPSYETGRLTGLGRPTAGVKAQQVSWPSPDGELPIYYRWHFRTGQNFDFEFLVKQLEPRIMDERVGVRPMDCSKPAFVQADQNKEVSAPVPPVMMLEGAMKAPNAKSTVFPPKDTPQPFFAEVQKLLNLNLYQQENPLEDPYVSIPYYGMYHAMKMDPAIPGKKVIPAADTASEVWYNDLNRDPRNRVPAGFGARVVQENQEKFMDRAWKQLSEVQDANKKMRLFQFTTAVSTFMYRKTVEKRTSEDLLSFTQPLAARILAGSRTVKLAVEQSLLPKAVFEGSFRRITRNNTSFTKGLGNVLQRNTALIQQMNKVNGLTTEAKQTFRGIDLLNSITAFEPPTNLDTLAVWSRQSNLEDDFAYNIPNFKGGFPEVKQWKGPFKPVVVKDLGNIPIKRETPQNAEGPNPFILKADDLKPVPGKADGPLILRPGGTKPKGPVILLDPTGTGGRPGGPIIVDRGPITTVSPAINKLDKTVFTKAVNQAYLNTNVRYQFQEVKTLAPVLEVASLEAQVKSNLDPSLSFKKLKDARIRFPEGMVKIPKEEFLEAMAYPDIPEASYKYLVDLDKEFLLPNLHLIPNNTLSLLKTNQKFIEAYLMGLNYEMGKELLWREYPTDMRGSYFRQFWDVSGFVTPDTTPKDADSLKDIKPIHMWPGASVLGKHNARDAKGDTEQLVFVIRGDLLKKFPNTVIYAQKAFPKETKKIIHTELTPEAYQKEVKFPLYQAEIGPDIKLLGFDLTIEEAAGLKATPNFTDKLGWFFILAEVPGEPRFGMDVTFDPNEPDKITWNDLSWENFGAREIKFLRPEVVPGNTVKAGVTFTAPNDPATGIWGKSSSDMAAILFQRPVMVAIHATEMLDVKVPEVIDKTKVITLLEHITISRLR
ncbi:hypothetical protein ACD591_05425 [Rufibacter glacialis]|uniref:Uncharacterized protein n=1 Tax=Rufibacter glacialis TaxID=1259555 RepID=A0A5M8QFH3_9BACT|nr:hypothetical protein [Rufibacter glacialis]KAA6434785.1 hypothetical protein FOE74_11480 [Rufibacter glacialis]GGK72400.1 hypothetical protein GCM10011405_20810 [Rufibacter glacialis]